MPGFSDPKYSIQTRKYILSMTDLVVYEIVLEQGLLFCRVEHENLIDCVFINIGRNVIYIYVQKYTQTG